MNKDLLASIIFSAGCFLFFYLAVPQYDKALNIKDATQAQQILLNERAMLVDNVKNLANQYQSRKTDIDRLAILLPERKQLDQVISALEATAAQSGLQIRELTIGADIDNKLPKKINIKFQLLGNYETLLTFLKAMEKSLRVYNVSEISLGKENAGGISTNNFTLEIKLDTYNLR